MTLHEAEAKLTEINNSIAELLQERENVLKEWSIAFYMENPDEITCIAEDIGIMNKVYNLYLINGDSKMLACHIPWNYKECSINDFYKQIDISMQLLNDANGRGYEIPELQRNLVYAKAMELRDRARKAANYTDVESTSGSVTQEF
ncbi:MAG: hypothetical protein HDR12_03975 [Lachnospiraceae bacterium]|nr:hypothetical protein [Lachnospiraceae bacterium]